MCLNFLYPVYSLIHLFPDSSTLRPAHHHRNNHTLDPSTCFLDTLYFLFNYIIASAAETFLTKTFLTLWRHSASNGMPSILKLDSILLTLLSTVIRVSFLLSLSQKGICSSIVYHKTLHLYYKFSYYEERTYNLLRYQYHFIVTIHYISGAYHSDLPLYTIVIRYFAILYEVCKPITKYLPSLVNQVFLPLSTIYFSSTTWKMINFR